MANILTQETDYGGFESEDEAAYREIYPEIEFLEKVSLEGLRHTLSWFDKYFSREGWKSSHEIRSREPENSEVKYSPRDLLEGVLKIDRSGICVTVTFTYVRHHNVLEVRVNGSYASSFDTGEIANSRCNNDAAYRIGNAVQRRYVDECRLRQKQANIQNAQKDIYAALEAVTKAQKNLKELEAKVCAAKKKLAKLSI